MDYTTSKDGTRIAFEKSGSGPALAIVGGALADYRFYAPLASELAERFTVYNMDRRRRGHSGDTQPYAVEREIEDVAAVIAGAAGPALLYGHSAGAALALRVAAVGVTIARLVLVDPPFTPHGDDDDRARAEFAEETARVWERHDRGDHAGNARAFLGGYGLPEEDLDAMLQASGEAMIDSARALPYDYAVLGDGLVPTELAAQVAVPTVVLAADPMAEPAQALASAIPAGRFEAMEASAHELPPDVMAGKLAGLAW
jgi:pimeloyl-ACP methyl ester carboxylesterase